MEWFECGPKAHLKRDRPNKGQGRCSAVPETQTNLVEYHDLAEFKLREGIYLTDFRRTRSSACS